MSLIWISYFEVQELSGMFNLKELESVWWRTTKYRIMVQKRNDCDYYAAWGTNISIANLTTKAALVDMISITATFLPEAHIVPEPVWPGPEFYTNVMNAGEVNGKIVDEV